MFKGLSSQPRNRCSRRTSRLRSELTARSLNDFKVDPLGCRPVFLLCELVDYNHLQNVMAQFLAVSQMHVSTHSDPLPITVMIRRQTHRGGWTGIDLVAVFEQS